MQLSRSATSEPVVLDVVTRQPPHCRTQVQAPSAILSLALMNLWHILMLP
jgi:hypothetical protein